ncbi:MAG: DUF3052 domain-containing protein [Actinomycetota bacterium]|nr:DUF3052 domain-containing protein [Actinomycetota bacterium]
MPDKDYSATPLWKKFGIKEGSKVVLSGAPRGFASTLKPMPTGVRVSMTATRDVDVILLFAMRRADVTRRFSSLAARIAPNGGIWIAYPKKSSGMPTDLTFEVVQQIGLGAGLVDNKSIAVDEVWSGVRFVYRLKDRPKE